ncbi:MAG: TIGR00341 family protein, partial [Bacteroidetes bacterium]
MSVSAEVAPYALEALKDEGYENVWMLESAGGLTLVRLILRPRDVERILDILDKNYGELAEFRVWVLDLEAVLPRQEPEEDSDNEAASPPARSLWDPRATRISREELYSDVSQATVLNWSYLLLVALSVIVATVGMVRGSQVVVLGAMVIAPLLNPNVALALASTLGDGALAVSAVTSLLGGA